LIHRPRLGRKIAGRGVDLVLLVAPAGYGKTVLARQFLEQVTTDRRAWLDLDGRDDDPRRFGAYFLEALARPVPELRRTGIQKSTQSGELSLAQMAEEFCFLLQESRRPPCWMVLDNWEQVNASPEIGRFIISVAAAAKGKIKLIIASRVAPSFGMRRLQERGVAVVADRKDLAFTFFEFRDAAIRRLGARVAEEDLEEIWRLTEGWCVHLGLVLESLGRPGARGILSRKPAAGEMESLLGYVEEELLPHVPAELVDFLMRCSPLEVMSPPACAALVGGDGQVACHLKSLTESSIPSFPLPESGGVRLHPLIREAVGRLLRQRLPQDEVRALYHRAAEHRIDQGLLLEGIRLLLDIPDHGAALEAIHRNWFRIVETGGQGRVHEWLYAFPEELRNSPKFVVVMTNALSLEGDNARLLDYLSDKITPASFPGDDQALANSWMHYYWAWLHESEEPHYEAISRSWMEIIESRGPFPPIVLAGIENIQGYAALLQLDFERAAEHYHRSLDHQNGASFDYAITTRNNIALCLYMQGDATGALAEFRRCAAECAERSAFSMLPMVMINIAEVCHATGDLDAALESIDRCLEIMRAHAIRHPYIDMTVDRIRGMCAWHRGRWDEASALLDAALRGAERCGSADQLGLRVLIEYVSMLDRAMAVGSMSGGRARGRTAGAPPPRPGHRSENRLAYLAKEAWRATDDGDPAGGGAFLAELLSTAGATGCLPWMITGHLLAALHADLRRVPAACMRHLREGLRLLAASGWRSYPMANPRLTSFVYARSVRWGLEADLARRLVGGDNLRERSLAFERELRLAKGRPDEIARLLETATRDRIRGLSDLTAGIAKSRNPATGAAAAAYAEMARKEDLPPLWIRMLGGFSVTAGGTPVIFSRRKSRLLLQMLLIEHPSPIHEEVLLETFWPEADPARGRAALQSAVKDLRQALDPHHEPRGQSYIEYDDRHYSLRLPEGSTCDAHVCRESIRRALAATAGTGCLSEADEASLTAGLALFGGELLPDQRLEPFAQEFRERLHRQFLDATLRLARSLNGRGKHADAIRALERGVELDTVWGEGVQELMLTRAQNGELCRALRVYREYERSLKKDLHLSPDPDIQRSFENLLSTPPAV
jgi:ATP/maltotriose-dependent transcriptional regulator MalT/DNA-binding SARP family transcriptional activator